MKLNLEVAHQYYLRLRKINIKLILRAWFYPKYPNSPARMASYIDAMTYAQKWRKAKGVYRKVFGHKSPYRRIYGGRNPGEALDVTMKEVGKLKGKMKQMKERLNVEKKHIDEVHTEALPVGQFVLAGGTQNDMSSGHQVMDVTPSITQGTDFDERTGNSLKFTGFNFKINMNGQGNTHSARKVRFTLVRVSCAGEPASTTFTKMFDPNPLSSLRYEEGDGASVPIYDLQAPLNYANLKSMGITVLAKRQFYLPARTHSIQGSSADGNDELTHKSCSFSVKLKDVARYSSSSATEPENFRYYLFIQTDVGNASNNAMNSAQLAVHGGDYAVIGPATGVAVRFHSRIWYVDN